MSPEQEAWWETPPPRINPLEDRYNPDLPDEDVLRTISSMRSVITRIWRELNHVMRPAMAAGHVSNMADMKEGEAKALEWLEGAENFLQITIAEALDRGLKVPVWKHPADRGDG